MEEFAQRLQVLGYYFVLSQELTSPFLQIYVGSKEVPQTRYKLGPHLRLRQKHGPSSVVFSQ